MVFGAFVSQDIVISSSKKIGVSVGRGKCGFVVSGALSFQNRGHMEPESSGADLHSFER